MSDEFVAETASQRRRRRLVLFLKRGGLALLVYGAIIGLARSLHRYVVYQPPSTHEAAPLPEGAVLLTTQAADGVAVNALEFAVPGAARTVVHFHGNAETADSNAALARNLNKRGLSVVLVEYRGYGRSGGASPNEDGVYQDAAAVIGALAARGVGKEAVVLWGQSLGTGVATEMALRGLGAKLVLVAAFTSMVDMGRKAAPLLPMTLVMADRFDNFAKAPRIAIPVFEVHGDIDDVIPVEQGQRLAKAFPNATYLEVPEGRHDNLYKRPGVFDALATFALK